jgi:hypothetical protein
MSDPTLRSILRDERAEARAEAIGPCDVCGSHVDLTATRHGPRCYEHRLGVEAAVEADHVAGIINIAGLTVRLRGNAHRRVEMIRTALGMDEWPDAEGDPFLELAHLLGGLATLLWLAAQWLIDSVAARRLGIAVPEFPFG